jgi:beta-glucosidase
VELKTMRLPVLKFIVVLLLHANIGAHAADVTGTPKDLELRIEKILSGMSLQEKIGQTAQLDVGIYNGDLARARQDIRAGRVGSYLNATGADLVNALQKFAVEESPSRIPLVFARDVIHGYKTIFPIPIGQAAGWNPDSVQRGARIAAEEATTAGVRWTFAPMMDIARDPRWGRIAESFGEDPYLSSVMAQAMIRGFQGEDLSGATSIAACAKHFAAYGAAEGGRDYNTVSMDEALLRNVYLQPFHASVEAGVATFMSSFNELNGVPATGNRFLLTDVLRGEWGFDGMVVSDYNSIKEMITHGYAENSADAAKKAIEAGLDMEMASNLYRDELAELIKRGHVSIAQLDDAVRRILRIKLRLGLFDNPYTATDRAHILRQPEFLKAAHQAAADSIVLLKNKNDILPLSKKTRIAVIGPLADAPYEQMGTWVFDGEKKDTRTPWMALRDFLKNEQLPYAKGLETSRDKTHAGFTAALDAAKRADVILFFGGEESILSGEAHSRADIRLPGAQETLIHELRKTGKPLVLIIMAGRPITLGGVLDHVDALLMAWHPGTMGGPALVDILYGEVSPSARLPLTWPKSVGQIPVYYNHKNTGRPPVENEFIYMDDISVEAIQYSTGNTSHYLDIGFKPEFPFGFGLTYSRFEYKNIRVDKSRIKPGETVTVSATLRNTGKRTATETVQLYVQDVTARITRPVRELKGFEQVTLRANESRQVEFTLHTDELSYFDNNGKTQLEPGVFNVWVAPDAEAGLQSSFTLLKN